MPERNLIVGRAAYDPVMFVQKVHGADEIYIGCAIEDAVAGSTLEAHQASLRAMEYLQSGVAHSMRVTATMTEQRT